MKILRFLLWSGAAMLALAPVHLALGQPIADGAAAELQLPDGETMQWSALPLQNVAPRVMAYWIDPIHNNAPPEWMQSGKPKTAPQGAVDLFNGISLVVPVDSRNSLLVLGNATDTLALQNLVATLDKPLSQAKVEVAVVAIAPAAMSELGIKGVTLPTEDAPAPPPPPSPFLSLANPDALSQLKKVEAEGKAVVLTTRSLTLANNIATQLVLAASAPLKIATQNAGGEFQPLTANALSDANALRLAASLDITATLNADSVELRFVTAKQIASVSNKEPNATITPLQTLQSADSIINVKNNDTIAVFGFAPDFFPLDKPFTPEQIKAGLDSNVILLIKTRVVAGTQ